MQTRSSGLLTGLPLLFAAALSGQPTTPPGRPSPEIISSNSEEIVVRSGKREWHVDLSRLIRNEDCAWPYVDNERVCNGRPTAPCAECRRRFCIIGWDFRYRRLYFGLSTGTSKNNPWTIFNYSLITQRITRFTTTWAAAVEHGKVSRSGRYLAYLSFGHGGMCANYSSIEIVDLWDRRTAKPNVATQDKDEITDIQAINWLSASVLEYEAEIHGYTACREGNIVERPVKNRIDVTTLAFH